MCETIMICNPQTNLTLVYSPSLLNWPRRIGIHEVHFPFLHLSTANKQSTEETAVYPAVVYGTRVVLAIVTVAHITQMSNRVVKHFLSCPKPEVCE